MGAGIEPASSRRGQQATHEMVLSKLGLLLYLSKVLPLVDWLPTVSPPQCVFHPIDAYLT